MPVTKRATTTANLSKLKLKDLVADPVPDFRTIDERAYNKLIIKAFDRRLQYLEGVQKDLMDQRVALAKRLGIK
jgi:hypothetical protein